MWLLLVLQVYLHQIINLNTNVLKVFQVFYNSFLVRDYYVCKKSKFLTSLPPFPCMHTQNDSF